MTLAVEIVTSNPVAKHVDYAQLSDRMASVLYQTGETQLALARLDSAEKSMGYLHQNPDDFSQIYRYDIFSEVINSKTNLLFEEWKKNPTRDPDALATQINRHLAFLNTLKEVQINPAARLDIFQESYALFSSAVAFYYDQYQRTGDQDDIINALKFSEKTRDQLLSENLIRGRQEKSSNLDPDILNQENNIQRKIADIELLLFRSKKESKSKEAKKFQEQKKQLELELEKIWIEIGSLESKNEIAELKTSSLLNKARKMLGPRSVFIEFFQADNADYVFIGSRHELTLVKLADFEALQRQQIALYGAFKAGSEDWQKHAHNIFAALIPVWSKLPENTDHLVIIPHGSWGYLPFETLLENGPDEYANTVPPILLRKYSISYANSLSTLVQLIAQRNHSRDLLAAFAPKYNAIRITEEDTSSSEIYAALVRSGEYALPGAQKEVESITALLGGTAYLNDSATKEAFHNVADQYQIVHLSMHALLEEEDPKFSRLLFTKTSDSPLDNSVFASELYNMNLDIDLAVLSACNTGAGQIKKGEGIMSLSRAFQHAGVASTVHSLWKVPDDATAEIMVGFYSHLKDGVGKAEALRRAKLGYLENAVAPQRRHPFYWAGFIASGNISPVISSHAPGRLLIILSGGILLLLIGFFLVWRSWKAK